MSTNDIQTNLYPKKFVDEQTLKEQTKEYLNKIILDISKRVYENGGVFQTHTLSSSLLNTIDISTPIEGINSEGFDSILDPTFATQIPFENITSNNYHVGIKPILIPKDVETGSRTGRFEYRSIIETIGLKGSPNSIVDNGNGTITFIVDNVVESGVSNVNRTIKVWLKTIGDGGAVGVKSQVNAFEEISIVWDGSNNKITTTSNFGQTTISVDSNDYEIALLGPIIKKNTDIRNDKSIVYLGNVDGNTGDIPSTFDLDDVILLPSLSPVPGSGLFLKLFSLVQEGGTLTHDNTTPGLISWSNDLKIRPLGTDKIITISASNITLADDEVAYVELSDPVITETVVMKKTTRSNTVLLNSNVIWIFNRTGLLLNVVGGLQLEQGEQRQLDDVVIGNSIFFSNDDKIRFEEGTNIFHFDADGGTDNANIAIGTTIFSGSSVNNDKIRFTDSGTPKWEILTNDVIQLTIDEDGNTTIRKNLIALRDVLTNGGSTYVKDSDATDVVVDGSLNEVYDQTKNRDLLRLKPNNPPDKELNVESASIVLSTGETIGVLNQNVLSSYTSGTINFNTGVVTGGGSSFTPYTPGTPSNWFKYGIALDENDNIIVILPSGDAATKNSAPNPVFTSTMRLQIIDVQDNGTGGSGTINDIDETNLTRIVRDFIDLTTAFLTEHDVTGTHTDINADNITVTGTTSIFEVDTFQVEDPEIILGLGLNSDALVDGGGFRLKGDGDYYLNWINAIDSFEVNQNFNLTTGFSYKINGTDVLTNNTLGSGIVNVAGILTQLNVDNLRLDGNTILTTNTNGDLFLVPDGSGDVLITSANFGINTISASAQFQNKDGTTMLGSDTWPTSTIGQTESRVLISNDVGQSFLIIYDARDPVGINNGGMVYIGALGTNSGANLVGSIITGAKENATSGSLGGYLDLTTSNSGGTFLSRIRIDSNGLIGIGTTTPGNWTHEDLVINKSGDVGITISTGTTNIGTLAFADGTTGDQNSRGYVKYIHNGDDLIFGAGGVDRLQVESGTSTVVRILTTGSTSELEFDDLTDSGKIRFIHPGDSQFQFITDLGIRLVIKDSGGVQVTNLGASADVQTNASGEFITISDKRHKKDLGELKSGLSSILKIFPHYFQFLDDLKNGSDSIQLGFFAQDVKPYIPEAAPYDEKTDIYHFNSKPIIAYLVKSIHELNDKIENLKQ